MNKISSKKIEHISYLSLFDNMIHYVELLQLLDEMIVMHIMGRNIYVKLGKYCQNKTNKI